MTTIAYLNSPQARITVAKLIEVYPDQTIMNTLADFRGQWGMAKTGIWRMVHLTDTRDPMAQILTPPLARIYYRPDGDHFIVSDLGDGTKAWRLRTGQMAPAGTLQTHAPMLRGDGILERTSTSADLPNAICSILLATLRIANLGAM